MVARRVAGVLRGATQASNHDRVGAGDRAPRVARNFVRQIDPGI